MASTKQKAKQKENLKSMARDMFEAAEKEAYFLGDMAIGNLEELMDHLDHMTEEHAPWLADWLEYLGDAKTAKAIRKKTSDFKGIIKKRYKELSKHKS